MGKWYPRKVGVAREGKAQSKGLEKGWRTVAASTLAGDAKGWIWAEVEYEYEN